MHIYISIYVWVKKYFSVSLALLIGSAVFYLCADGCSTTSNNTNTSRSQWFCSSQNINKRHWYFLNRLSKSLSVQVCVTCAANVVNAGFVDFVQNNPVNIETGASECTQGYSFICVCLSGTTCNVVLSSSQQTTLQVTDGQELLRYCPFNGGTGGSQLTMTHGETSYTGIVRATCTA